MLSNRNDMLSATNANVRQKWAGWEHPEEDEVNVRKSSMLAISNINDFADDICTGLCEINGCLQRVQNYGV